MEASKIWDNSGSTIVTSVCIECPGHFIHNNYTSMSV